MIYWIKSFMSILIVGDILQIIGLTIPFEIILYYPLADYLSLFVIISANLHSSAQNYWTVVFPL